MAGPPSLPSPPTLTRLLAAGPVALFLDFDGTLVEIAPDFDGIAVPKDLAARLVALRDRLGGRLALVSGRGIDSLVRHIGPLPVALAGSHGSDRQIADGSALGARPQSLPGAAVDALRSFADDHGLTYEAKAHGGALHYRAQPDSGDAANAFADAIAARYDLSVKRGKAVAELVRPGANKAGAVRAFMAEPPFAGATPVFLGDDVTDEDGFAGAIEFGGFGVAVGDRQSAAARYRLETVTAVHNWLET